MESDAVHNSNMTGSVRELLAEARRRLEAAGVADPQRDARLLMRWAAGWEAAALSIREADPAARVSSEAAIRFWNAITDRSDRRPVSQIIGRRAFFGREFKVTSDVLDPRPESEALVEAALERAPPDAEIRALDLGVGSGCLIVTLLAEWPRASGLGVDVSAEALAVAGENARALGVADRLELRQGDWLDPVAEGGFDLILCNPPYIDAAELDRLEPEVVRWEPMSALSPGADGLSVYRRLAREVGAKLTPGGSALFEVGLGQARRVRDFMVDAGLDTVIRADLGGLERVVMARKPA